MGRNVSHHGIGGDSQPSAAAYWNSSCAVEWLVWCIQISWIRLRKPYVRLWGIPPLVRLPWLCGEANLQRNRQWEIDVRKMGFRRGKSIGIETKETLWRELNPDETMLRELEPDEAMPRKWNSNTVTIEWKSWIVRINNIRAAGLITRC